MCIFIICTVINAVGMFFCLDPLFEHERIPRVMVKHVQMNKDYKQMVDFLFMYRD